MNTTPSKQTTIRRPNCVTEVRMGNTVLNVSGYFKRDATDTSDNKKAKNLEAEIRWWYFFDKTWLNAQMW